MLAGLTVSIIQQTLVKLNTLAITVTRHLSQSLRSLITLHTLANLILYTACNVVIYCTAKIGWTLFGTISTNELIHNFEYFVPHDDIVGQQLHLHLIVGLPSTTPSK